MPAPVANRDKLRITRSFTGCDRCKKHRKKCDEAKPSCQRCLTNRATCSYTPLKTKVFEIIQHRPETAKEIQHRPETTKDIQHRTETPKEQHPAKATSSDLDPRAQNLSIDTSTLALRLLLDYHPCMRCSLGGVHNTGPGRTLFAMRRAPADSPLHRVAEAYALQALARERQDSSLQTLAFAAYGRSLQGLVQQLQRTGLQDSLTALATAYLMTFFEMSVPHYVPMRLQSHMPGILKLLRECVDANEHAVDADTAWLVTAVKEHLAVNALMVGLPPMLSPSDTAAKEFISSVYFRIKTEMDAIVLATARWHAAVLMWEGKSPLAPPTPSALRSVGASRDLYRGGEELLRRQEAWTCSLEGEWVPSTSAAAETQPRAETRTAPGPDSTTRIDRGTDIQVGTEAEAEESGAPRTFIHFSSHEIRAQHHQFQIGRLHTASALYRCITWILTSADARAALSDATAQQLELRRRDCLTICNDVAEFIASSAFDCDTFGAGPRAGYTASQVQSAEYPGWNASSSPMRRSDQSTDENTGHRTRHTAQPDTTWDPEFPMYLWVAISVVIGLETLSPRRRAWFEDIIARIRRLIGMPRAELIAPRKRKGLLFGGV